MGQAVLESRTSITNCNNCYKLGQSNLPVDNLSLRITENLNFCYNNKEEKNQPPPTTTDVFAPLESLKSNPVRRVTCTKNCFY